MSDLRRYLPGLALNSLAARLIATAAVWTVIGLLAGGLALSTAFRTAVEGSFDSRLSSDLDGMIAAALPQANGDVTMQGRFSDPRFDRIYSGWYWEIVPLVQNRPDLTNAQISRSLFDGVIHITDLSAARGDGRVYGHGTGPENQRVRLVERRLVFPVNTTSDPSDTRAYLFIAAGDMSELDADIARFNRMLAEAFVLLGAGLIAAIVIQVRVGLQPLRRLRLALMRIRDGKARQLEGTFPAEIMPLADELNGLIAHSAEVVGRARTHVSNLAHALKTPLSVLSSEAAAEHSPLADAVMRQVEAMRRQVDHYLVRARAAGALDVLGARAEVMPALGDLVRVLRRIHAERGIEISLAGSEALAFRGERQDLAEMAGNLIDNACKWARTRVHVEARALGDGRLSIAVGDDGPGLTAEERARVGERGERLDESVPGSGLGLAITRDIAKLYGGDLTLGVSSLGGLEATLTLPLIG